MPIRPELRHFYGRAWREEIRPRILKRAGGKFTGGDVFGPRLFGYTGGAKCEQCGVPDRLTIARFAKYPGWWFTLDGKAYDEKGTLRFSWSAEEWSGARMTRVVLAVAHRDHDPANNADENLAALCGYCHLNWDKLHHAETRATRKDRGRPLIQALSGQPSAISPEASA